MLGGRPFLLVFTLLNSAILRIRFPWTIAVYLMFPVLPAAFLPAFVSFYRNWTIEFLKASIEGFEGRYLSSSKAFFIGRGQDQVSLELMPSNASYIEHRIYKVCLDVNAHVVLRDSY